jgi:hypothetical protein
VKRTSCLIILAFALLGVLAAASGCGEGGGSGGGVPGDAIATVGETSITKAQFDELIAQAAAQLKQQGASLPKVGTPAYNEYAVPIVDYLVQNQIVLLSAPKYGVSVTDAEVAEQVAQMEKGFGGAAQMKAKLQEAGLTAAMLRTSMQTRLVTQALQTEVLASTQITDGQVKGYWDAHKEELSQTAKTATLAKAKSIIRATLLAAAQREAWAVWLEQRAKELGVEHADGYDTATMPTPTASASAN